MKFILLFLLVVTSILSSSCSKDEVAKLIGTKWKSADDTIKLNFTTREECKVIFTYQNKTYTEFYSYTYEPPDIVMLVPAMTGFPNYKGTVSRKEITLISQREDQATIKFRKIK